MPFAFLYCGNFGSPGRDGYLATSHCSGHGKAGSMALPAIVICLVGYRDVDAVVHIEAAWPEPEQEGNKLQSVLLKSV